ncbi:MAG: DUF6273 domain-containing protein, partial [Actinobacteria bacterium]|nr:DUF6273 domain-containing protein [Actinomycetota bacterium]
MKSKIFFLSIIIVFILTMIPATVINADPAISGTSLNLYKGAGVLSDSYVKFGQYNGSDIIWRVLRQDDGTKGVLLISEEIITTRRFDLPYNYWESSELRTWLNGNFYNGIGEDNKYIKRTEISTANNIGESEITNDYIFIPDHPLLTSSPFNSTIFSDTKRIAVYSSNPYIYWTRSKFFDMLYYVSSINGSCNLARGKSETETGVRPLLYLKPNIYFSGTGTI